MTGTLKLYEATEALGIIRDWFDEPENIEKLNAAGGDISAIPELAGVLEEAEASFAEKAEMVALYVRELVTSAKAIEDEEKRLSARRKAKERAAESLKGYLLHNMQQSGIRKVEGQLVTVAVQKSPASVKCTHDADALRAIWEAGAEWVVEVPATYRVDAALLKDYAKDGRELPEGVTVEQGEHVRIR